MPAPGALITHHGGHPPAQRAASGGTSYSMGGDGEWQGAPPRFCGRLIPALWFSLRRGSLHRVSMSICLLPYFPKLLASKNVVLQRSSGLQPYHHELRKTTINHPGRRTAILLENYQVICNHTRCVPTVTTRFITINHWKQRKWPPTTYRETNHVLPFECPGDPTATCSCQKSPNKHCKWRFAVHGNPTAIRLGEKIMS